MDYDQDSDNDSDNRISDDDEAQIDYSDSDEEDDNAPPRKKPRRQNDASMFFDREVEESDESEGEYGAEYSSRKEQPRDVLPVRKNFADISDEQLQQTGRRFESLDYSDEEEDAAADYFRRAKPTPNDPRIFKVACKKPGEERRVVGAIMEKFHDRYMAGKPLAACSAFCLDHVKGYVFVEAKHSSDVKQAIEGILSVSMRTPVGTKTEAIRLQDMISMLRIPKSVTTVEEGSWVRVKRGVYSADLGQVHRVDESKGKVWIKLIPRIDLNKLDPGEKRKRKARAAAVHFNAEEMMNRGFHVEPTRNHNLGDTFQIMEGKMYKDGYLFREIDMKNLELNVTPSIEEVKKFQGKASSEQIIASINRSNINKKQKFAKGDKVRILRGPLKNVDATVQEIQNDTAIILPNFLDYRNPISVELDNIQKFFQNGDNVKVITGNYKGETGLILSIKDDVVSLFSNDAKKTIKVLISDVQQNTTSAEVRVHLKNYRLHDLVQIGQNSVGMIIKVNADSFQVLETTGEVKRVPLSDVGMKRKSHVTFDKSGNQISARDEITVVEGTYKGKEGTVKYVYRHHLFVETPGFAKNGGFFVVRSNIVVASGRTPMIQQQQHRGFEPRSPFIDHNGNSRAGQGRGSRGRGGGGSRGGRGGRNDPNVGKKVKIKKGTYRGYEAIIRESNGPNYRVELLAKSKIISVPIDDVIVMQALNEMSRFGNLSGGQTPMIGDRTPMIGDRTPMIGDRTPIHSSMVDRTPARDSTYSHDHSMDYPISHHDQDYNSVTPSSNFDSVSSPFGQIGTPSMNYPATPSTYSIDTPGGFGQQAESPYAQATPQLYPSTPATPGMMNPQTPGFGDYDYGSSYEDTLPAGIEVRISDAYDGSTKIGVITDDSSGPTAQVRLNTGQTTYISWNSLEPTVPSKNDRVRVIAGKDKGVEGIFTQFTGNEVLVTAADTTVFVELKDLGKCVSY